MAAGTKITLALVALLIVALTVYYSSLTPDSATGVVVDESPAPSVDEPPAPRQPVRREARPVPPREVSTAPATEAPVRTPSPTGRILGDSVEQALGSSSKATPASSDAVRPLLGDRAPVTTGEGTGEGGGKDTPEPAPTAPGDNEPEDEPTEPEEPAEPQPAEDPEPQPRPQPEPPAYTEYTVRSGDTMSSIAGEWFGDQSKWDLIAKANPLVDPNRLRVGQALRLPPKDVDREDGVEAVGTTTTTYVVRSGDSLSRIARQYYGDESKWRIIFDANRDLLGDDPHNLRVGMRLRIPPAPQPAD